MSKKFSTFLLTSVVVAIFSVIVANANFIKNLGQWDSDIKYVYSKGNQSFVISDNSLFFDYFQITGSEEHRVKSGQVLKISFENAEFKTPIERNILDTRYNYFIGDNPEHWKTNVYAVEELIFPDLYSNVDLLVKLDNFSPRYDFIVKPNADPTQIVLNFEGVQVLGTDGKNIRLLTRFGEIVNGNLFAFQMENGIQAEIECRFKQIGENRFAFELGNYDKNKILIIDPIVFQSYFGGSGNEEAVSIVEVSTGIVIIAGWTESTNFPTTPGAYDASFNNVKDVFITKLDLRGATRKVIWSTFLGGSGTEYPAGMEVDELGNIYVGGTTNSTDFPLVEALGITINGQNDAFITKLNPDGNRIVYSTYVGGTKDDITTAMRLAPDKGVIITGYTTSTDFPVTGGAYQNKIKGREDIFVFKLSSSGKLIEYGTYIGGGDDDRPYGMAVSITNNIFIVGGTKSSDFPAVPYRTGWGGSVLDSPYDRTFNGGWDAFAIKILGDGGKLDFCTYFGGTADDIAYTVTYTNDQRIIFAGITFKESISNPSFPLSENAFQSTHKGNAEIFIASLSNIIESRDWQGNTRRRQDLVFSTFLGGSGNEYPTGLGLLPNNTLILTGFTNSTNFPIVNNPTGKKIGKYDLIYVNMSLDGSSVLFSDILGTSDDDSTKAFFKASNGDYYFAAVTNNKNLTQINPLEGASYGGQNDLLLIKNTMADLRLDYPVGKEELCPNTNVNIRWVSEEYSSNDTFDIDIKLGANSDWTPLAKNVKGMSYTWSIPATTFGDQVWLRVSHKRGNIAVTANPFKIFELPTIEEVSKFPENNVFCEGDTVYFKVVARGSKLKYQWMFNNSSIPNATDTVLMIADLKESNSGQYKVIVSGACPSTVESQVFTINVKPKTTILLSSADTNIVEYSTLKLYVYAKGDNLTYEWFKDGSKLLGQNKNELIIENVSMADSGTYKCVVSGTCGMASTQDIIVKVEPYKSVFSDNEGTKFLLQNDNSVLTIVNNDGLVIETIRACNLFGIVYELYPMNDSRTGFTQFDISTLHSGFYTILVKVGDSYRSYPIVIVR